MAWGGRGVQPLRGGGHRVRIGNDERGLLGSLAAELRGAIEADDAAVARLYPPAYRDDERANDEFGRLTRGELTAGRVAALRTLESTCRDTELTEADANAWCGALNDLRLVLGERLGVTEELYEVGIDPNDPRAPELALYGWLTWLQGELVESLSARL